MEERVEHGLGLIAGAWPPASEESTVLFIHGSVGSKMMWEEQVAALSERVNTVAIDLPGHGESKGPGRDTVEGYAKVILDFLDQTNLPNPIPCGLSIGGAIVQHLLIHAKGRFKAGILVNTGARLKVMPMIFDAIKDNYSGFAEMMPSMTVAAEDPDSEKWKRMAVEVKESDPDVVYGNFKACDAFDVMKELKEIDVPVLVLAAEQDKMTPPKYGQYLKDNLRCADLVTIPGAGHLSPLEKPAEFNEAVMAFLDRHGLCVQGGEGISSV
jgi:pimeloyl-ACP methyl ester carboxylesterase